MARWRHLGARSSGVGSKGRSHSGFDENVTKGKKGTRLVLLVVNFLVLLGVSTAVAVSASADSQSEEVVLPVATPAQTLEALENSAPLEEAPTDPVAAEGVALSNLGRSEALEL